LDAEHIQTERKQRSGKPMCVIEGAGRLVLETVQTVSYFSGRKRRTSEIVKYLEFEITVNFVLL
jgi:hypothetical protein